MSNQKLATSNFQLATTNNMPDKPKKVADSKLADSIMHKIEREQIKPVPGWRFVIWNGFYWVAWGVTIVVGSAAVAASIFVISNAGWKYYAATSSSFFEFFVKSLPYLWIVVLLIFIILSVENFKKTKRGYRLSLIWTLLTSVGLSCLGGAILFYFGFGYVIDEDLGQVIPFHQTMIEHQKTVWNNPPAGLVAGEVVEVDEAGQTMLMQTFNGTELNISTASLMTHDLETLANFNEVRVVGYFEDSASGEVSVFTACLVIPWEIYGHRDGSGRPKMPGWPPPSATDCEEDSEINLEEVRNNKCKDVRPYEIIIQLTN